MKKIFMVLMFLILSLVLIACETKNGGNLDKPELPIEDVPNTEEPIEEEPIDEKPVEEPVIIEDKQIILDTELRNKGIAYTAVLDTTLYSTFKLSMTMTGTYDNPITINKILINGISVDLTDISGLPKKASDIYVGQFTFTDMIVNANRVTNYQGLRIKSTKDDVGFIEFSLDGIISLEIEMVFTTSAAQYFDKVIIDLKN